MADLTTLPLQDNYQSTLSQAWDGAVGTIYVNTAPSFTFPAGKKCYIVVNPEKSNMQVARISAYNSTTKTITVDSITVDKGNGIAYTQQSHAVGSKIMISDSYQFRQDLATAIDSKVDTNSDDTATGKFADATARDAYFTSPVNGNTAYLTSLGAWTDYVGGSWVDRATGSTPNASTTVAGKVEKATSGEVTAGTSTGGTGAELFVGPAELKVVTDAILSPIYFGDGADGDVTISSGTTTLTRDMYYNNLTITSPGVLNPAGYRVFVKGTIAGTGTINRNGNAGSTGSGASGGGAGAVLSQGSLNMEVTGGAGGAGAQYSGSIPSTPGVAGTSANSMTNINGVAGGNAGGGTEIGGAGGTSTRGGQYNQIVKPYAIIHGATNGGPLLSIAGSGGGGGCSSKQSAGGAYGGGGGGAGGNGGFIWIAVKDWDFTGTVTATGGAGGAGGTPNSGGGGGGGGGGNGGILFRMYTTLTADCTKTLTGGAGGAGSSGNGTYSGMNGSNGTTGATGETISIVIS